MARQSDIKGMSELEATFRQLGRVPQTVATKSARAGGTIARRAAKNYAPVDTGDLKSGIIMKRERTRTKGRAVFDVMVDPKKADLYRRKTKSGTRRVGGKGSNANNRIRGDYFYPASMEYGYFTVDGRYIPGDRYLRKAVDNHEQEIERKMLEVTGKEVDKALRKRRGN